MPHFQSKNATSTFNESKTTTNAIAIHQKNELSGSKENPNLYIHARPPMGNMKGANDLIQAKAVGMPYKVKTKLPFYDKQGKFNVDKVGLKYQGAGGSP